MGSPGIRAVSGNYSYSCQAQAGGGAVRYITPTASASSRLCECKKAKSSGDCTASFTALGGFKSQPIGGSAGVAVQTGIVTYDCLVPQLCPGDAVASAPSQVQSVVVNTENTSNFNPNLILGSTIGGGISQGATTPVYVQPADVVIAAPTQTTTSSASTSTTPAIQGDLSGLNATPSTVTPQTETQSTSLAEIPLAAATSDPFYKKPEWIIAGAAAIGLIILLASRK